jgi:hypothetical protein
VTSDNPDLVRDWIEFKAINKSDISYTSWLEELVIFYRELVMKIHGIPPTGEIRLEYPDAQKESNS